MARSREKQRDADETIINQAENPYSLLYRVCYRYLGRNGLWKRLVSSIIGSIVPRLYYGLFGNLFEGKRRKRMSQMC